MRRSLSAVFVVAVAGFACVNVNDSGPQQLLVVSPILDSVFVGDILPARSVYLVDAAGNQTSAGPVAWSASPSTVATVDASGNVTGVGKGAAVVVATRTDGVQSGAVVIVSRPLELTLLMDTVFLMPGDTFTVPVAMKEKTPGSPTLTFDPSPDGTRYTIDANGQITAVGAGGAVRYVVHLSDGAASVTDTGAVIVASLTDTSEVGSFFMTAVGTAIRHQSGPAIALNYQRLNGKQAFQLSDTLRTGTTQLERVLITLPDSVITPGTREIDSISPQQAETQISQLDPFCQPRFPWAGWYIRPPAQPFVVYSHATAPDSIAGYLIITQYVPVTGGAIISGRYQFQGQRTDLYSDPLGSETIRGTFVAPLRTRLGTCQA